MSTSYSNRTRDLSHTQRAEGQEARETFIPRNWHSDRSWRLTFRSSNPQHTDASQDQPYSPDAGLSTKQRRVREQDVSSRAAAHAQSRMLCHTRSPKREQTHQSGAVQLKAFAILFPSYEPVLYLNSESTTLREATRL